MSDIGLSSMPTTPVDLGDLFGRAGQAVSTHTRTAAQTEQAAKDFESILLSKVLEEMDKTIPRSGLLEGGSMKQVRSMFWSFLARDMADKGGLGLWKQLQKDMLRSYDGSSAHPAAPKVEVSS